MSILGLVTLQLTTSSGKSMFLGRYKGVTIATPALPYAKLNGVEGISLRLLLSAGFSTTALNNALGSTFILRSNFQPIEDTNTHITFQNLTPL